MGQKVNPIGFRIAVDKNWRSRWFADKRAFGDLLDEDCKIRKYIQQKFANSAVAEVRIERYANRVRINIHSARPGVIMGHKGEDIAKVREELSKKTGKEIALTAQDVLNMALSLRQCLKQLQVSLFLFSLLVVHR